jgi:hypothetical protein
MSLNREERKLLHQKSKQPTFGNGKPDSNEGNEGDIAYRQIQDSGLVQYVKQNGSWVAVGSQGDMPETRDVTRTPSGGGGVGTHSHGEFIKKDGSVAYTGNQSFGTNNITNVGTLDVDGATTLDQVTINTTDGAFAVSGANAINLTTTGANKIVLTSGNDVDIVPTGDLDIDANNMTVDTTRAYTGTIGNTYSLTGSNNMTIQATGTAANTLLVQNTNNHSSSFTGLHLKTDSGGDGGSSGYNRILIECDNIAAKGADYGVDIRSENNIRIRAEDANNGNATGLLMRATGPIDIGVASSITPHTSNSRVKIHGVFETGNLWRDSNAPIVMDKGTIEAGSSLGSDTTGEYTKFEAIDTKKLINNFTHSAKDDGLADSDYLRIIDGPSINNTDGTMYKIYVGAHSGSLYVTHTAFAVKLSSGNFIVSATSRSASSGSNYGLITVTHGTTDNQDGIEWRNNLGSECYVYGVVQRIIESSDYP